MNWLGSRPERDWFGKFVLKAGISPKLIREWSKDPQVTYGVLPLTTSLFDKLEDTNSDECLALMSMMAPKAEKKKEATDPQEKELESLRKQLESLKALEQAALA